MSSTLTIAVDAMSGDHGARVAVSAAIDVLADNQDLRLLLVGRSGELEPLLRAGAADGRCEIVEASEVVGMHERPQDAVRKKKNSSMRVAVNLVRDGRAAACGTGAAVSVWRWSAQSAVVVRTTPPCAGEFSASPCCRNQACAAVQS